MSMMSLYASAVVVVPDTTGTISSDQTTWGTSAVDAVWGTSTIPTTTTTTTTATTGTDWQAVSATEGAVLPFASIASIVRSSNFTIRANAAGFSALKEENDEVLDDLEDGLDGMDDAIDGFEDLADAIDGIADLLEYATDAATAGGVSILSAGVSVLLAMEIATFEGNLETMEDTIDTLEELDYDAIQDQYDMVADTLVMAAESTYIGLASVQETLAGLKRSQVVVNQTMDEMQTRYSLGQIAEIDLLEVEQAKISLDSAVCSLEVTFNDLKGDFNLLLGRAYNYDFAVGELPTVTDDMIAAINLATDTTTAISNSLTVQTAEDAVDDAEDLDTDGADLREDEAGYNLLNAQYTVRNSMSKLYNALLDKQRLVAVAESALNFANKQLAVNQLKYDQGTLTRNELLTSEQEAEEAISAVTTAQMDVFAAYNAYQWGKQGVM